MTYFEFTHQFPDEKSALDFIVEKKYIDGVYTCPRCGCTGKNVYRQKYNSRFLCCNNCHSESSVLTGTIFEGTHLDLRMWLYAMNLVIISRKGISALQLQREFGMKSYKGAWRMMKKIREAMGKEEMEQVFEAVVEIDETYVGGKPRKKNKHGDDDEENNNKRGRGTSKTPVIGVRERSTGKVHAVVAKPDKDGRKLTGKQLFNVLRKVCKENTTVMTDQLKAYDYIERQNELNLFHLKIDHSVVYSLGSGLHTNGIESFWAILKRGIYGIFHHVSIDYMQDYVNEFCFRLNYRDNQKAFTKLVELAVL